ncbi:MAG: ABC transporter permease, partial [Actinomycetales bacterium]
MMIGNPNEINLNGVTNPTPPTVDHPLGTDDLGRDIATRIADGARISLAVGFSAMTIAICLGTLVGLTSGYIGGKVDELLMRSVDFLMGLPTLFI